MEFLILFFTLLVGIKLGWNARERHAVHSLNKLFQEAEQTQLDKRIIINVEQHSGCFYIFNKNTSEFMAQGKTIEEVEKALLLKFPGKRFAASEETIRTLYNDPI